MGEKVFRDVDMVSYSSAILNLEVRIPCSAILAGFISGKMMFRPNVSRVVQSLIDFCWFHNFVGDDSGEEILVQPNRSFCLTVR